jgi:endonuclease/exonuclease/phosphatase family metal-dependent hydrolase
MRLKIFCLNCWLAPFPISVRNNKRLVKIISLIKKHSPDIIALQEVWLKKYVRVIERKLPDYHFIKSDSGMFNRGGLVTGLKKPKSYDIRSFPITKRHNILERLGSKGFHIIELYPNVYIINTHLYSSDKEITGSQFQNIQKFSKSKNCILIGDLNLERKNLAKINTIFTLDKSDYLTAPYNRAHSYFLFNRNPGVDIRIDYILKTKNSKMQVSTQCLGSPIVSDHRIILGNVKI